MKRIVLSGLLLLPLMGICQQEEKDAMAGYYDLKQADVMAFFSKDSVDKSEISQDLKVLNTLLSKDIGEKALLKEMGALDRAKDSVAFYNLVTTKPSELYRKKADHEAGVCRRASGFVRQPVCIGGKQWHVQRR
ncbi:hypothetical protein ACQ86N_17795 [Puia sp. P3]|uniref:hypothetical protein n=1 Tax=Puia sp. P3 TaxID=3423952 RepID=UPI003D66BA59